MKLLLLHGPATNISRQKLVSLKEKFTGEMVVFEKGTNDQEILATLTTLPLISEQKLVVLESIDINLENLPDNPELTLIIWFEKTLNEKSPIINFVKKQKGEIMFFPEAKEITVFPFLDSLGSRQKKAFLELEKLKKAGLDTQYLFTMIFYLLRNLIYTSPTTKDFVKNKNQKMRANFTAAELKDLYKFILETDFNIKSGLLSNKDAEFAVVGKFTGIG